MSVDIDGRSPSSPLHALHILSSYRAGEKLELNVLRVNELNVLRVKMSFDITIPEDPWEGRLDGVHFMPDDVLVPAPPPPPGSCRSPFTRLIKRSERNGRRDLRPLRVKCALSRSLTGNR